MCGAVCDVIIVHLEFHLIDGFISMISQIFDTTDNIFYQNAASPKRAQRAQMQKPIFANFITPVATSAVAESVQNHIG